MCMETEYKIDDIVEVVSVLDNIVIPERGRIIKISKHRFYIMLRSGSVISLAKVSDYSKVTLIEPEWDE